MTTHALAQHAAYLEEQVVQQVDILRAQPRQEARSAADALPGTRAAPDQIASCDRQATASTLCIHPQCQRWFICCKDLPSSRILCVLLKACAMTALNHKGWLYEK